MPGTHVENTGGKDQRDRVDEAAGLFAASASEGLNSEEEWQDKAAGHPRNEVPRHASAASAGVSARCGNHCRPEFLWVQAGTRNLRCGGTVFHFSRKKELCGMGARSRHPRLFRQHQS